MLPVEEARKNPFAAGLMKGRTAIVTGGGTGIARATAPLDETAKRYLARIDSATLSDAPLPPADLKADLHVNDRAKF